MALPIQGSPQQPSRKSTATGELTIHCQGIYFFATHPNFYPLIRSRLLPCTLLSLFVLGTLFTWTYLPQVAFLAIFHGRAGAWLNATFLVLGEGAAITALLFEAFFVDEAMVDVFDAVRTSSSQRSTRHDY